MRRTVIGLAALPLAIAFSACGSDTAATSAPASSAPSPVATTSVTIANFAFSPTDILVTKGQTVTFTNTDSSTHTVTSDSGDPAAFDSGNLTQNKTFSFKFTTSGTYGFHCSIHEYMKATITVQ